MSIVSGGGLPNKFARDRFETRSADDAIAAVDRGSPFETEITRACFFRDDLQRREVPGLPGRLDPEIAEPACDHDRVVASAETAHRPERFHEDIQPVAPWIAPDVIKRI